MYFIILVDENSKCSLYLMALFISLIIYNLTLLELYSVYIITEDLFNSLRAKQNGHHFADDIFKCIFFSENVLIPIEISLKFVPKSLMNSKPVLVQIMVWHRTDNKPLFEPMMALYTDAYTVECLYNVVHYNAIFHTTLP